MPKLEHVEVRGTNLDILVKNSSFDYAALTPLPNSRAVVGLDASQLAAMSSVERRWLSAA
jgi:hypothetical protein